MCLLLLLLVVVVVVVVIIIIIIMMMIMIMIMITIMLSIYLANIEHVVKSWTVLGYIDSVNMCKRERHEIGYSPASDA